MLSQCKYRGSGLWCAMLSQWLLIIVCNAELVVVIDGVLI